MIDNGDWWWGYWLIDDEEEDEKEDENNDGGRALEILLLPLQVKEVVSGIGFCRQ